MSSNKKYLLFLLFMSRGRKIDNISSSSVKENDFLGDSFPTYGALYNLVSTQLTSTMTTEKDTVFSSVHTYLTLGLGEEGGVGEWRREGGRKGRGERERERGGEEGEGGRGEGREEGGRE